MRYGKLFAVGLGRVAAFVVLVGATCVVRYKDLANKDDGRVASREGMELIVSRVSRCDERCVCLLDCDVSVPFRYAAQLVRGSKCDGYTTFDRVFKVFHLVNVVNYSRGRHVIRPKFVEDLLGGALRHVVQVAGALVGERYSFKGLAHVSFKCCGQVVKEDAGGDDYGELAREEGFVYGGLRGLFIPSDPTAIGVVVIVVFYAPVVVLGAYDPQGDFGTR